jgi:hypothetical protein
MENEICKMSANVNAERVGYSESKEKMVRMRRPIRDLQYKVSEMEGDVDENETEKERKLRISLEKEKERVKELKNENATLKEEKDQLLGEVAVETKDGKKYNSNVRSCYQSLMCLNVGARNCKPVVKCVLKNMVPGLTFGELPAKSFAADMFLEARAWGHFHIFNQVFRNDGSQNLTLGSDGTSQWGKKYQGYDLQFSDGDYLCLGVREVKDGSSQTALDLLKEIVDDVCSVNVSGSSEIVLCI